MDQMASLFGVDDHALLLDCRTLEVAPVALASVPRGARRPLRRGPHPRRECLRVAAATPASAPPNGSGSRHCATQRWNRSATIPSPVTSSPRTSACSTSRGHSRTTTSTRSARSCSRATRACVTTTRSRRRSSTCSSSSSSSTARSGPGSPAPASVVASSRWCSGTTPTTARPRPWPRTHERTGLQARCVRRPRRRRRRPGRPTPAGSIMKLRSAERLRPGPAPVAETSEFAPVAAAVGIDWGEHAGEPSPPPGGGGIVIDLGGRWERRADEGEWHKVVVPDNFGYDNEFSDVLRTHVVPPHVRRPSGRRPGREPASRPTLLRRSRLPRRRLAERRAARSSRRLLRAVRLRRDRPAPEEQRGARYGCRTRSRRSTRMRSSSRTRST